MKLYKNVRICEADICFNNDVFGRNLSSVNPLECASTNNQECKSRPEIVNVNNNEPVFYPSSMKTSKFSGNCNNINDVNVFKNVNTKVLNLMSRTNKTRLIKWHETCKCKCRLDAGVCNSKQRWNRDKCRCECQEMIDKGICDKGIYLES